ASDSALPSPLLLPPSVASFTSVSLPVPSTLFPPPTRPFVFHSLSPPSAALFVSSRCPSSDLLSGHLSAASFVDPLTVGHEAAPLHLCFLRPSRTEEAFQCDHLHCPRGAV